MIFFIKVSKNVQNKISYLRTPTGHKLKFTTWVIVIYAVLVGMGMNHTEINCQKCVSL